VLGALLMFVVAAWSAGIAIAFYPATRRYNETLALGAVVFRAIEAVFYVVAALCLMALLVWSRISTDESVGDLLRAGKDLAGFVFAVLAFCLGGSMDYIVLYRARLVPSWLSLAGLVAPALLLSAVLVTLFNGAPYSVSGVLLVLAAPIAIQEIVLAGWLLVKGFAQPAPTAG
jgi:hypothetical protein